MAKIRKMASIENGLMEVIKRNGKRQPVQFDKITTRIKLLLTEDELKYVDPIQIAHDEILKQKISNKKNLEKINTEVINKIKEAAEYALESPFPKDEDLYKDVYI